MAGAVHRSPLMGSPARPTRSRARRAAARMSTNKAVFRQTWESLRDGEVPYRVQRKQIGRAQREQHPAARLRRHHSGLDGVTTIERH